MNYPTSDPTASSSSFSGANPSSVSSSSSSVQLTSEQQQPIRQLVDMPVARVRRIMKSDADVRTISQEAVIVVSKAAEKIIEHLARESLKNATKENRKTIQYSDMSDAVKSCDVFDFLEDIIPERKSFESILEMAKKQ
ncbi:hypothetical protein FDP41_002678 [Naegleria fowleri]|uniref:Chromatin accessibility complex protein 1 n=1 Tax=Naegleria fowleri TaxID=5763 RepID=A0A6A5BJQ0_NAEFO|nr:uncharacterized protein FDP41_002678 [Naegleria fowleri]KAF0978163.1 hypothetical protein FDP41_002678 [Naegleria fowleri]CAG4712195.1 unnamed protein product [Naegleria fowleri]